MPTSFCYTARAADGAFLRGLIECSTEDAALAALRTRALYVTSIWPRSTPRGSLAALAFVRPISKSDLVGFFRAFATMVRAGVSIRRALDVTIQQCGCKRLAESLRSVAHDIDNGLSLSDALERRPAEFAPLHVIMIRTGEMSGTLDGALDRLASALERDRALRKRVSASLAYPLFVSAAAIVLTLFLVATIVPMFESLYSQMHVPLSPLTVILIEASHLLRSPAALVVAPAGAASALWLCLPTASRRARMELLLMRVPVVKGLLGKSVLARLSFILGTLLHSGVALMPALETVSRAMGSPAYRKSIEETARLLRGGACFSDGIRSPLLYPPLFVQLVRVGEETGTLDMMLLQIAQYYDLDVETALTGIAALLEPAMVLLLGGVVGFIVSAIFIPLYTLIGNIK